MPHPQKRRENAVSRRFIMIGSTMILAGTYAGATMAAAGAAPTAGKAARKKISQRAAGYRATPNGKARCDNCNLWIKATSGCTAVMGLIQPQGWCNLYATKA